MQFSAEQREFAAAINDYCRRELATVAQRDAVTDGGALSNSPLVLADMARNGWLGVSLPEEYGGGGAGFVDECIFLEESSRGLAPLTGYSTGLTAAQTYLRWGTDDQKKTVVTNLTAGRLEAIALSEPGAGSDLAGLRVSARRDGDRYIINGQKTWISAAHVAEHILVLTREDSSGGRHQGMTLLMVPTTSPGLTIRAIDTMEAHTCNDVFFTDVEVPVSAVVGEPRNAWKQLMRGLSIERLIIAAMSIGGARRALDDVVAYAKEREQFGQSLASFQALRHRMADLATDVEIARVFLYDVAAKIDAGLEDDLSRESAMAKMRCTEVAKNTTLEAMQMMGGYGYAREYGMEGQVRRALAPPIYGGTNEIQREIIAKTIGL
ncbi:acyl-CoA dehydrogenase family protein [Gordonia rubripertincta]|uniref:Acyl-CoA/acyl-ACP dehydrogenase n=2 Tax=Gordonia rubripertincta TaxID=36822 RepID=A0AAW6REC0_GORRU|nr:acyl-CoA dehydrogenase family protein [Gordonia rubripertincta]ASR02095.1 Acyl-CoA dehydrogenase [Gordonia rubripertincta]MDG6782445.1 acyl-CoA/acyl-ACP dehydrogenase [Gordonia rubripertincta]NKY64543.1 acyl-CoA/acyl-ACP dehydrogenase [Gordonia rubripertincta]GAB84952.1 putative acyl-CoA dehydrogenase [Gordonia rubripertincta NBRC 101908]